MHGLVNSAIECFVRDTYGNDVWADVAAAAELGFSRFETMLVYDDGLTCAAVRVAAERLAKPLDALLEDIGTYLVSHPNTESIRRLMRFGGVTFEEFLHSLDDLPDRVRLAVPDLTMPMIEVQAEPAGRFSIRVQPGIPGFGSVLVGLLRAMADDYGALAIVDVADEEGSPVEIVQVSLLEHRFAEGRRFELAVR